MKKISIQLTLDELQELLELVENQLFRIKFIDPKIPGPRMKAEKIEAANSAVKVLKDAFKSAKGFKSNAA
jgi:ribosome maturation protein Sdo1